MATYTYKCTNEKCDLNTLADEPIILEVQQSMKDEPLTICPDCKKETLKKVIMSAGGGFRIGGKGVHKPTAHWGS